MRLINADALRAAMFHEAFETDTDEQRWDSGCWIRYKMFERILEQQPTVKFDKLTRLDRSRIRAAYPKSFYKVKGVIK